MPVTDRGHEFREIIGVFGSERIEEDRRMPGKKQADKHPKEPTRKTPAGALSEEVLGKVSAGFGGASGTGKLLF